MKPWWVWDAINFVEAHLRPTDQVLEVGSGYSTVWLAQRCGQVCSIEESSSWREIAEMEISRLALENVRLITGDSWKVFQDLFPHNEWDVVVIDSPQDRLNILLLSSKGIHPPRLIIYDDTDKAENRAVLSRGVPEYQGHTFRGFKPQTIHACETTVYIHISSNAINAIP